MKKQRCHPGQSLVEFALLFPLALLLITGFFDLGRAIFYYSSLTNAVREAARYAIIDNNAEIGPYKDNIDVINKYSFGVPDVNTSPTIEPCYPGPCTFLSQDEDFVVTIIRIPVDENQDPKVYVNVRVEANFTFKPITPGIVKIFGDSTGIDLVAQSTMRISAHARY